MTTSSIQEPRELLRVGYGLIPFAAGADKFTNLLTDWEQYLDPRIARASGLTPKQFMRAVGVIEMTVGGLMLTRFRKHAAYVASGWLAAIAGQLLAQRRFLDIAARDVLLSLSAFAFARLEAKAEKGEARAPRQFTAPPQRRTLQQPGRVRPEVMSPAVEETSVYH